MTEVVCDTSPIFYLDRIGRLELLEALYARILVPPAVMREFAVGVELGLVATDLESLAWVESQAAEGAALSQVPSGLGPGEREVLALGLQSRDRLLILDDRVGRRTASELGLECMGTLGVLLKGKRQGRIERMTSLIEQLRDEGFRIEPRVVASVLRLAGEEIQRLP